MNEINAEDMIVKGIGTVTPGKSPMERLAEEEENEGGVEKTENLAVPANEPVVIDKYEIGKEVVEESEGMVTKTEMKEEELVELKRSHKKGFDPNSTINAVHADGDNEGGVLANRMAVPQDAEGNQFVAPGSNTEEIETKDKYEITGFSIQYQPHGSKGIASEEVRDFYDTMDEIIKRVKADSYMKPDGNIGRISRGAPVICFNDRQIKEYINEEWRKA
jgi:hypothetical protein